MKWQAVEVLVQVWWFHLRRWLCGRSGHAWHFLPMADLGFALDRCGRCGAFKTHWRRGP